MMERNLIKRVINKLLGVKTSPKFTCYRLDCQIPFTTYEEKDKHEQIHVKEVVNIITTYPNLVNQRFLAERRLEVVEAKIEKVKAKIERDEEKVRKLEEGCPF